MASLLGSWQDWAEESFFKYSHCPWGRGALGLQSLPSGKKSTRGSEKTDDMQQALVEKKIARGEQRGKNPDVCCSKIPCRSGVASSGPIRLPVLGAQQCKALPTPYPVALARVNSCNTGTLDLSAASWRFGSIV